MKEVDAIDSDERREERSSFVDEELAMGFEESEELEVEVIDETDVDSRRAIATATPSKTARRRSGRSKMCEELGWRIYLC
jgi:hypothetical protein